VDGCTLEETAEGEEQGRHYYCSCWSVVDLFSSRSVALRADLAGEVRVGVVWKGVRIGVQQARGGFCPCQTPNPSPLPLHY
jgi:hypothetical protein